MDLPTILLIKDVPLDLTLSQIMEAHARRASFVSLVTQITTVRMDTTRHLDKQLVPLQFIHRSPVLPKLDSPAVPQIRFVIMACVRHVQTATLLSALQLPHKALFVILQIHGIILHDQV